MFKKQLKDLQSSQFKGLYEEINKIDNGVYNGELEKYLEFDK